MKPESGYHPIDIETISNKDLRLARYKGFGRNGDGGGVIVYKVYPEERSVVYSGLSDSGLSTINGTASILESLMKQEPLIDPAKFRFFDVQTVRGYEYYKRGSLDITEIRGIGSTHEKFAPNLGLSAIPRDFWPLLDILSNP